MLSKEAGKNAKLSIKPSVTCVPPAIPDSADIMGTIILIILVLLLIGALPTWGHSRQWGYAPSGGLGLIVVILIILLLMGKL